MNNQDPSINPLLHNAGHSNARPSYVRRTVHTIIALAVALLLVGGFISWYFFTPATQDIDVQELQLQTAAIAQDGDDNVLLLPEQAPGNSYQEETGRSDVYNFFYKMFGGIEDGLDENPHNLNNLDNLDNMNIETSELFSSDTSPTLRVKQIAEHQAMKAEILNQDEYNHSVYDVIGSDVFGRKGDKAGQVFDILINKNTGQARAIIVNEDDSRYERDLTALSFKRVMTQNPDGDVMTTVTEEKIEEQPDFNYSSLEDTDYISLRHLRDGQLLDYEGKLTGQIDAVIYQNAEAQNIYFTLRPLLAQQGITKFQLPFDDVNIVESADGYDIQLTKDQTIALAEMLFKE